MATTTITISYKTSVFTPAGWRSVTVTGTAEQISPKRCKVISIDDVDGNGSTGYASRTGANRQRYSVTGVAVREEGVVKNLSSVSVL